MPETPIQDSPRGKGRGCCLGAGIGCLAVLLIFIVLAVLGARFGYGQFEAVMQRFEREGYKRVQQRQIEIVERLNEPTIFVGEFVRVKGGSDRGMAILAPRAEVDGDIVGNVHFYGGELTVHKGARLRRDLHLKCAVAHVYGLVEGEITGVYGALDRKPAD